MSESSTPSLDGNYSLTLGEDTKINSLLHTPLKTLVDVLLPDDLVKVGLGLRVVEGVHSTRQVGVSGGGGGTSNHNNGTSWAVLGDETRG
jgi:hypothetical protein